MLINCFLGLLFHSIFKSKKDHLHIAKKKNLQDQDFSSSLRIGTLAHDPLLKNGPYGGGRKEGKKRRKGRKERKEEKKEDEGRKEGRKGKNRRKKRSVRAQEQPGRRSLHLFGRGNAAPFPGRWEHLSFSRVYSPIF